MKKNSFTFVIIILFTLLPAVKAQTAGDFKPNGKIFGLLYTNFHTTFSGGDNTSAFEVTRSYLGYDYLFSETISSRILYDGTTESINGKTIYSGYLRNAYLQFDNKTLLVRGGLIGSEQIAVMNKIWDYRFVNKAPIDYSGMIQAADLGLMTRVSAGERLVLDLSVTNGRGFKDITGNGTYRVSAGFTLTPVSNVLVRGFYDMMGPSGRMQRTASLTAAWMGRVFTGGAEYLRQNNNKMVEGNDYSGISIFTTLKLSGKVSLYARYDNIGSVVPDTETDPWNIDRDGSYLFAGIDFSPVRNVRISPNFTGYIPADQEADFLGTVGLNVEARF